jgi:hypothetical protein
VASRFRRSQNASPSLSVRVLDTLRVIDAELVIDRIETTRELERQSAGRATERGGQLRPSDIEAATHVECELLGHDAEVTVRTGATIPIGEPDRWSGTGALASPLLRVSNRAPRVPRTSGSERHGAVEHQRRFNETRPCQRYPLFKTSMISANRRRSSMESSGDVFGAALPVATS